MRELVRHQPRYELSHHLGLVIYSLDGEENLSGADRCYYRTEVNKLYVHHYPPAFYLCVKLLKLPVTFLRARDVITKFIHSTVRRLHSWMV